MSKLEQLIAKLCPNGVEYKELGEMGNFGNIGVDKKINDKEQEIYLLNYMDVYKNNLINKNTVTANTIQGRSKNE